MKKSVKICLILLSAALVLFAGVTYYANDYYRAEDVAEAMATDSRVMVGEADGGWLFDGPGEENILIFYPGGKVEETAYAPLMKRLAEGGTDCYLVKMPLKLAVFGADRADAITQTGAYPHCYLAGHSLGGAMAARYAADHGDSLEGLFLLGAYPDTDLTNAAFPVVFIYGSDDGVINRDNLETGLTLVPADSYRVVLEGGNHAGFGNYGDQKGDGAAVLTPSEQQAQTAEIILSVIDSE